MSHTYLFEDDDLNLGIRPRRHRAKWQRRRAEDVDWETQEAQAAIGDYPELGFNPTYLAEHKDHHEWMWVVAALSGFYDDSLITDVLHLVKGGKEASVYCCQAHPATGKEVLAAKIYRPRMHRNLKNDALYREGRQVLDEQGKITRGTREQRAMLKKTRFGAKLEITSWIEHEFQAMRTLYAAGVDLPQPLAQDGKAILMEYVGEEGAAAPALQQVSLSVAEARLLFERLLEDIRRMLDCNLIHADLSAYNVLYWEGEIKIIDFPQAVSARTNRSAQALLTRDVERICQYFARYRIHPPIGPADLAAQMWRQCMGEGYGAEG